MPEFTLQTERTRLTLLTIDDLPAMETLAREPDTFKYIRKLAVMDEATYTSFLHLKLRQIAENKGFHWAVWIKPTNEFIGAVNLNPIGSSERLQIGCQLKRAYWGQGFASELMARLVQFGMDELKLSAVYGVFEKDNIVSRRLLKKIGFVFEKSTQEQDVIIETHQYSHSI